MDGVSDSDGRGVGFEWNGVLDSDGRKIGYRAAEKCFQFECSFL